MNFPFAYFHKCPEEIRGGHEDGWDRTLRDNVEDAEYVQCMTHELRTKPALSKTRFNPRRRAETLPNPVVRGHDSTEDGRRECAHMRVATRTKHGLINLVHTLQHTPVERSPYACAPGWKWQVDVVTDKPTRFLVLFQAKIRIHAHHNATDSIPQVSIVTRVHEHIGQFPPIRSECDRMKPPLLRVGGHFGVCWVDHTPLVHGGVLEGAVCLAPTRALTRDTRTPNDKHNLGVHLLAARDVIQTTSVALVSIDECDVHAICYRVENLIGNTYFVIVEQKWFDVHGAHIPFVQVNFAEWISGGRVTSGHATHRKRTKDDGGGGVTQEMGEVKNT